MRKSNKILAVVMALVMMLTTVPMMTAMAADEAEEHVHVFKETVVSEADCAAETNTVKKYVCECGLSFSKTTEEYAHKLVGTIKENDTTSHKQWCDVCDSYITAEHTFVETVTKAATCKETGKKDIKCSVCGYEEKDVVIDKVAHTYTTIAEGDINETYHMGVCTVCNDSVKEEHIWNDGVVTTKPQCDAKGVKTFTCTVCKATRTEELKSEHTLPAKPTSINDDLHKYTCAVAGCGHVFTEAELSSYEKTANHSFVVVAGEKSKCDGSVALTITCEDCNYKLEVAAKEHNFNKVEKYDEKDHKQTCEDCNLSVLAAHEWEDVKVNKEPTCGVPGSKDVKCKVCEETATIEIAVSDAHNVETWTEVTPATCSAVGTEKGTCKNCNKEITREIPKNDNHTVTTWTEVTAPTCKEVGSEKGTCTVCNEEVTRDIPKTEDHKWGNWTTVVAPSVLLPGTKIRTCDVCGKIETESIPKLDGEQEVLMGDVNGDGEITSFDARKALQAAVGNYELSEGEFARADMNGDKEITSMDARKILKLSVGLEA